MLTNLTRCCAMFLLAATSLFSACDGTPSLISTTASVAPPAELADTAIAPAAAHAVPKTTETAPASPRIDYTADAATILARPEVPILCYHQIRDWTAGDSELARTYIVPEERFKEQIKMLADSGYHTISPDELMAYLTTGAPLPEKPIMLTFDDTNLTQYEVAAPELEKYGFKGTFFVMTVSLGRPRYMTRLQVKELAERGHSIGSHTWDHHNVKKYAGQDWTTQVEKPKQALEEITGQPVTYFAYPFGLWNQQAIPELKRRGTTAAFQLAASQDGQEPLHTIRRIIASGYWSASSLHRNMVGSFNKR